MYRPPYGAPVNGGPPPGAPFHGMPGPGWQRPRPGGMIPPPQQSLDPSAVWKEHKSPEGRLYWYNNITKQSTWEKPDDLLTPEEKVLKGSDWKEYTSPEGKKYYSNSKTKETVWEIPTELKEQIEKLKNAANEKKPNMPMTPDMMNQPIRPPAMPSLSNQFVPAQAVQAIPEYITKEDAEKAFFGLLKEVGVKSDWNWDQAMRAIITKPLYRALKTIGERRAAFHAYVDAEAKREREEREQLHQRQKTNFFTMLQKQPQIQPYTQFRTFSKMCGDQAAYSEVSEKQAREYFNEYISQVQNAEKDRLRDLRKESMDKFSRLLRSIPEITYKTHWKEAQILYTEKIDDGEFEGMDLLDFLSVFEDYSKELWAEPLKELDKMVFARRRKERKAREGFGALLKELVDEHKINARTLWKEIYPTFKDDERYTNAVGVPDSTPLDMFWEAIEDLDKQLYHQKKQVYTALKHADFEVDTETQLEDYLNALDIDERVKADIDNENIVLIFEHLKNKAAQRLKDEKRRQEKKLRKKLDMFRHALKHATQPPINLEDTWETVKPRVEHLYEYNEVEDETLKIDVFEKYLKRLKEKMEDEEEEEEGMIKEDEEGMIKEEEHMPEKYRTSRRTHRSDSEEERMKKRRKRPTSKGYSSAEEGEALDDYQNDPRRLK